MKTKAAYFSARLAVWLIAILIASALIGMVYSNSINWIMSKRHEVSLSKTLIEKTYTSEILDTNSDEAIVAFCRAKLSDIGLASIGLSADNFKPIPAMGNHSQSLVFRNQVSHNRFSVTFADESSSKNMTITIEVNAHEINCDFAGSAVNAILSQK